MAPPRSRIRRRIQKSDIGRPSERGTCPIPKKVGAFFSRLIPSRRSTGSQYFGRLKRSRPSCRSVNPVRSAMPADTLLIGPDLPIANFGMGQTAGMALSRWPARGIGCFCQRDPPRGCRFQSNCRLMPIQTFACRRRTDFGVLSAAAVLARLLLRSLHGVDGASF